MRGLDGDDLLASGRSGWVGYIQSSHSSPTPILNCAPQASHGMGSQSYHHYLRTHTNRPHRLRWPVIRYLIKRLSSIVDDARD